ncbi:DUF736 domain-containing protein [Phenylobacterium sp. J367]|uniref:DUF736 domain-containing protein n=1 Tax=Phenylobacterium sp. J367 TaxID=2898435 RepID=UPI002150D86B|nr:DUF736 domain-containing protein [Phenylobacterium sp. J367]MCR5879532.1 DUF736 domain-containing protein [Phenylobacterium sp. J367]
MTTIGTFTKAQDGAYRGAIRTLGFHLKAVEIRPTERTGDKAPDHRIFAGDLELGAAWTITRDGKPSCLSVRIDDPSLPAPIHALLVETETQHELRWSRRG